MGADWKLATLVALTSVSSAIFVVAAVAAMYFFYGAQSGDAPWSLVLWSIVIAVLARQVASILRGASKRKAYIEQLMGRGYSRPEADAAWRTAHNGGTNLLCNLQQADTAAGFAQFDAIVRPDRAGQSDI